jgi:RecG-like helicase
MANKNPVQTKEFNETKRKRYDNLSSEISLGKKVWSVRLPIDVEEFLEAMDAQERVALMRSVLLEAVRDRMNSEEAS